MRISDWSSDVCSSDLPAGTDSARAGEIDVGHPLRFGSVDAHRGCETAVRRDARNQGVPEQRSFPLAEAAHPAPREEQIRPYAGGLADHAAQPDAVAAFGRTQERRVGKEWVRTSRYRWTHYHKTQNMLINTSMITG